MNQRPKIFPFALIGSVLAVSTASIFIRFAQVQASSLVISAYRLVLASLELLPLALRALRRTASDLRAGRIPVADCVVTQKLSRTLEEFRSASPAARALAQLAAVDKHLRPGQRVRFLYVAGEQRVSAWDLPVTPPSTALDRERYLTLLLRAASAILQPLGLEEAVLRDWILGGAVYLSLPGCWRLEDGLEPGVALGLIPPREVNPLLLAAWSG
ncbi:MAG TPA: hypothetical protein VGJ97_13590 [Anaerolineaceae bacterium]|jgi:hypothetical protein